jgi:putative membrane protein
MKGRLKLLAGTAASVLLAGLVAAQTTQNAQRMVRGDNQFLAAAAQGGMAEVQMGQLAVQHASNDAVKKFGQRMVDDHSKANDELKALATRKGFTLRSDMDAKQKSTIARLSKLNGAEFDRAYMQDMVKDHEEDVAEFKRESDSGNDQDLKAFASKTLPTLQEHLQMAQTTQSQVK